MEPELDFSHESAHPRQGRSRHRAYLLWARPNRAQHACSRTEVTRKNAGLQLPAVQANSKDDDSDAKIAVVVLQQHSGPDRRNLEKD